VLVAVGVFVGVVVGVGVVGVTVRLRKLPRNISTFLLPSSACTDSL
jgi:hypothetical protein